MPKKNKQQQEQRGPVQPVVPHPEAHERTTPDFSHLVVLDFEATCLEDKRITPQEIIEFPMAVVEVATGATIAEFHEYVRPVCHATLSPFCTELTGIQQETVNESDTFPGVLSRAAAFFSENQLSPDNAVVVTCGDWDLKTALTGQLRFSQEQGTCSTCPPNLLQRWINIKAPFERLYMARAGGMAGMLGLLQLQLEGRHHSGIDDVRNTVRIAVRMLQDGWVPSQSDVRC